MLLKNGVINYVQNNNLVIILDHNSSMICSNSKTC